MGYYTYYELEVVGGEKKAEDYVNEIGEISGYTGEEGPFYDTVKWYDHEKDMKTMSQRYPDVLFILSGDGEESDDFWKEYHKNGKVQRVKGSLVYPEFDETKLI